MLAMEAWDVVVVGGTVAGLRAAIAAHDAGSSVTILEEGSIGSGGASTIVEGLAASLNETNYDGHANDTISVGSGQCDEATVRHRTASAFDHLAELERWGLVLRRSESGLPHLTSGPGNTLARVATTGDTTGREVYSILEEQCMKRTILRRADMQCLNLVIEAGQVAGLIALDVQRGDMVALKAKAVILATDGFESVWNGGSGGTGLWLASDAGITLSNLEFVGWNPLSMQMHGLQLPFAILNDGASVRSASGADIEFPPEGGISQASLALLESGEQCVLDARVLTRGTPVWYGDTSERVSSRLGGAMSETVIPINPQVATTLGGIPCDMNGQVTSFSGLFSAGDCACSGFHGADMAVGNRLLESIDGGSNAGVSAAGCASEAQFSDSEAMDTALASAVTQFAKLLATSNSGMTRGQAANQLTTIMSESMGVSRDGASLSGAEQRLSQLVETQISLSDESPIMNTELAEVFRLQGMIKIALAAVMAANARSETCGSHQRSDE